MPVLSHLPVPAVLGLLTVETLMAGNQQLPATPSVPRIIPCCLSAAEMLWLLLGGRRGILGWQLVVEVGRGLGWRVSFGPS